MSTPSKDQRRTTIYIPRQYEKEWDIFEKDQIAKGKNASKGVIALVVDKAHQLGDVSPTQLTAIRIESLENEYRKIVKEKEDMESVLRRKQTSPHASAFDDCYHLACSLLGQKSFPKITNDVLLKLYAYKYTDDEPFDVSDWDRFIFIAERLMKRNKLREIIQDARSKATGNLLINGDDFANIAQERVQAGIVQVETIEQPNGNGGEEQDAENI